VSFRFISPTFAYFLPVQYGIFHRWQLLHAPPELIGESPAFLDALAHASSAAGLDRPLLIVGERGSGKELIAGASTSSPRGGKARS